MDIAEKHLTESYDFVELFLTPRKAICLKKLPDGLFTVDIVDQHTGEVIFTHDSCDESTARYIFHIIQLSH